MLSPSAPSPRTSNSLPGASCTTAFFAFTDPGAWARQSKAVKPLLNYHLSVRVLSRSSLRRAAAADIGHARSVWREALAHGDDRPPLISVLDEWHQFSGADYRTMLDKMLTGQEKVNREWEKAHPRSAEEVSSFYDETDTILPLLAWWHGTADGPARCAAGAVRLFKVAGATRILDLGSGIGSTSICLAGAGCRVILSDVSKEVIDFAAWRMRKREFQFEAINLLETKLSELPESSIDGLTSFDVFEHLADLPGTLSDIDRLLSPNGVLMFNQIYVPVESDEPQHYPLRGEPLLWLHDHGYRLAHVIDVAWVAQKAPLSNRQHALQGVNLRTRIGIARAAEKGPRSMAFRAVRYLFR